MLRRPAPLLRALISIAVLLCAGMSTVSAESSLAALGERLFFDKRLSADGTVSCATCHVPEKAFTDGLPVAVGLSGRRGNRNTPTLWNVGLLPNQFWDGRRATLEQQALDPLLNPREHGIADQASMVAIVRRDPDYREAFRRAVNVDGDGITAQHVVAALAAFERTLLSDRSPFDRYLEGATDALSAAEVRGLDLFTGRARCASCHVMAASAPQFTDHGFHSLGVGLDALMSRLPELTQRVANADASTLDRLITADAEIAALGRFVLTKDPRDIGKFRTPSLRNVALTAPYMHDGSVATLEAAIDSEIYYRSLEANRPLILTPSEKADLVAFLNALTSSNARTHPLAPSSI